MTEVPAIPLSDDLVDRIATEIAARVADHIELLYPDAAQAVAWQSCKRSIQGVVRNAVSSAGRAAENGRADDWISDSAKSRRASRLWRQAAMQVQAKGGI